MILALGLLVLGGNQQVTPAAGSLFRLAGETVTVSYVADPAIGRGEFRLTNGAESARTAAVLSAWLESGDGRQPLAGVSVFDLDREQGLPPEGFEVGARATLSFALGFPRVAREPRFGESLAVAVKLSVNGTELEARSPIKFIRRIPLDGGVR